MRDHYKPPPRFDFDVLSYDQPFVSDENHKTFNAPQRSAELYRWIVDQDVYFRSHKHLFVPMGDDFRYQNAYYSFMNVDNLIEYWNKHVYPLTNIEL